MAVDIANSCGKLLLLCSLFSMPAFAATETVLYSLPPDSLPAAQLLQDRKGNLFGTTSVGGAATGTVFEVRRTHKGWRGGIIYSFSGSDGRNPYSALIRDNLSGGLLGNTEFGGTDNTGALFSLAKQGKGWTQTLLYSFPSNAGDQLMSDSWQDPKTGTLYGTTSAGGIANCGTVYQYDRSAGQSTLYTFQGGTDGCASFSRLRPGKPKGSLIGATSKGGASGDGTIFMLRQTNGAWQESVLYSFAGESDGASPTDIDLDQHGDIFGVTMQGGSDNQGTVFELQAQEDGTWKESILRNLNGTTDGGFPIGISLDRKGSVLYVSTLFGGDYTGGLVFSLVPSGGTWAENVLHSFGQSGDGAQPSSRVLLDKKGGGSLYGTTSFGGQFNGGAVYVIKP